MRQPVIRSSRRAASCRSPSATMAQRRYTDSVRWPTIAMATERGEGQDLAAHPPAGHVGHGYQLPQRRREAARTAVNWSPSKPLRGRRARGCSCRCSPPSTAPRTDSRCTRPLIRGGSSWVSHGSMPGTRFHDARDTSSRVRAVTPGHGRRARSRQFVVAPGSRDGPRGERRTRIAGGARRPRVAA